MLTYFPSRPPTPSFFCLSFCFVLFFLPSLGPSLAQALISSAQDSAATVSAVYAGRTDIYDDSPSGKVFLQLRDARFNAGNGLSNTVTVVAEGNAVLSNQVQTVTFTCNSNPHCVQDVDAQLLLPSWFDFGITGAVVTLKYGFGSTADTVLTTLSLTSRSNFVQQSRISGPSGNINEDVKLILPNREIYPGQSFKAYIDAHVGLLIYTFKFSMTLSPHLTVESMGTDDSIYQLISPPASGTQAFTSSLLFQGTKDYSSYPAARLITLNLRLALGAPTNVSHELSCSVIELKSVLETLAPIRNLTDANGKGAYPQSVTFIDRFGESATRAGQIFSVAKVFAGGALMYDVQGADFINDAKLEQTTKRYNLAAAFACTNGDLDCTQVLTCTSSMPTVLQVDSACAYVFMDGTEVSGSGQVDITARLGSTVLTTIPFRVWFPELPLTVAVKDPILNEVTGWEIYNGSQCHPRYQRSPVSLLATYKAGSLLNVTVDVTRYYKSSIVSSAPTVAAFSAATGLITGLTMGSTTLTVTAGGLTFGTAVVNVSNMSVSAIRLELLVITSTALVLTPNGDFSASERFGSKSAEMSVFENLVAENQQAYVYAHALFSDGTLYPLSTTDDDGLTLRSMDENIFTFDNTTQQMTLLGFSGSGILLRGEMSGSPECAAVPMVISKYFMNVTIVPPIDVKLNVGNIALTYLSQSVSDFYPNSQTLSVALDFQDTPDQDMTMDSRTIFDVSESNGLFTVSTSLGVPTIIANETAGVSGTGVLRVKFAHFAIFKDISVTLVVVTASTLSSVSYPLNSGPELTLSPYDNTNEFQEARLVSQLTFSNGNVEDVSSRVAYAVYATGTRDTSTNVSVGGTITSVVSVNRCCGVVDIYAKYNGKHETTTPVRMEVSSTPALLVTLSAMTLNPAHLVGFAGVRTGDPALTANFNDGTQRSITPGVLSGMLVFTSSLPGKATVVSGTGVLTLQNNHDDFVTLTATSVRNASIDAAVTFATNLNPGVGDVDLGVDVLPLAAKTPGSIFGVLVRVNTGGSTVNAIQLVVNVDFSRVSYVSADNHVGPGKFAVVSNPTNNLVEITATPSNPVTGPHVRIATLYFQVNASVSPGTLSFSGSTTTLKTPTGVAITTSGTPFVAGDITMRIVGSRRRQSQWMDTEANVFGVSTAPTFVPSRDRRGTTQECGSPPCAICIGGPRETGDADGNCVFDVADANFVGVYQNSPFPVEAYQMANMDADLSGVIDLIDMDHLFNVAATYSFFLVKDSVTVTSVSRVPGASRCHLEISVRLLERNDAPAQGDTGNTVAYLFLDIEHGNASFTNDFDEPSVANSPPGTTFNAVNQDLGVFVGNGSAVTPNPKAPRSAGEFHGGLWQAAYQGDGVFKVSVFTSMVYSDIGLSFIGVTSTQGKFDNARRIKGFFPLIDNTVEPYEYPVSGLEDISLSVRVSFLSFYLDVAFFHYALPFVEGSSCNFVRCFS